MPITTEERLATKALIAAIHATRSGLEMAAAIKVQPLERLTEDAMTFAMEQVMLNIESLSAALKACREANREAHRLVKANRDAHDRCGECGGEMRLLAGSPRDVWTCMKCNHQSK